jgi:hypothetical protein
MKRQTYDALILWRCETLALGIITQDLLGHGIVPSVISILQVLLLQTVLCRDLVSIGSTKLLIVSWSENKDMYRQAGLPEGTLVASFTIALQEEATDMGSVPLVMRIFPRHLLQHLLGRRRSELRVVGIGHHAGRRVGHLLFHDLGIELCASVAATMMRSA